MGSEAMNPLIYELQFLSWSSSYAWVQGITAALLAVVLLAMLLAKPSRLLRPAFQLASFLVLFYGIPLSLFAQMVGDHQPSAAGYALSLHGLTIALMLWVARTDRLTLPHAPDGVRMSRRQLWLAGTALLLTVGLMLAIYLRAIPWPCTALSTMFHAPSQLLLVREIMGKLSASASAGYAYGWLVSVLLPIGVALAVCLAWRAAQKRHYVMAVPALLLIPALLGLSLLGGAKGNAIPICIVAGFACAYAFRQWGVRVIVLAGVMAGLLGVLMMVDRMPSRTEHGERGEARLAQCVVKVGACNGTATLMDSLYARVQSLGMEYPQVRKIEASIRNRCELPPINRDQEIAQLAARRAPPVLGEEVLDVSIPDAVAPLVRRAFIMPFQVSVWHWLYVDEHARPSHLSLPMARIFFGESVPMAGVIYQTYASVHYSGDRTSTGSAPTGYLLAYPAYWGITGWLAALLLTIGYDLVISWLLRRAPREAQLVGVGLVTAASLNLIVSDFFTTMLTHGAGLIPVVLAAAIILVRVVRSDSKAGASQ